jgi:hypothetical protein
VAREGAMWSGKCSFDLKPILRVVARLGLHAFGRILRSKADLKSLAEAIDLAMHERQLRSLHYLHDKVTRRGMHNLEGILY